MSVLMNSFTQHNTADTNKQDPYHIILFWYVERKWYLNYRLKGRNREREREYLVLIVLHVAYTAFPETNLPYKNKK